MPWGRWQASPWGCWLPATRLLVLPPPGPLAPCSCRRPLTAACVCAGAGCRQPADPGWAQHPGSGCGRHTGAVCPSSPAVDVDDMHRCKLAAASLPLSSHLCPEYRLSDMIAAAPAAGGASPRCMCARALCLPCPPPPRLAPSDSRDYPSTCLPGCGVLDTPAGALLGYRATGGAPPQHGR